MRLMKCTDLSQGAMDEVLKSCAYFMTVKWLLISPVTGFIDILLPFQMYCEVFL